MGARAFVLNLVAMVFTGSVVYIHNDDQVVYMVLFSKMNLSERIL